MHACTYFFFCSGALQGFSSDDDSSDGELDAPTLVKREPASGNSGAAAEPPVANHTIDSSDSEHGPVSVAAKPLQGAVASGVSSGYRKEGLPNRLQTNKVKKYTESSQAKFLNWRSMKVNKIKWYKFN